MLWGLAALVMCPVGAFAGTLAARVGSLDGLLLAPLGVLMGSATAVALMMLGSRKDNARVSTWSMVVGLAALLGTTMIWLPLSWVAAVGIAGGSPGRPFRRLGRPVRARSRRSTGWFEDLAPSLGALSPERRRALAASWERAALEEHASVASFAELSLELLALGAPAELVARCHEAAIDEIAHARACFALASAYAGAPRGPDRLPIAALRASPSYASVGVASALDGCLNEGAAARNARAQIANETDPVVRAVLERIAEDEERHAALGADIVRLCTCEGGVRTAEAVRRALARAA